MSASEAHYAAERSEHLRNADEELAGGVGEDIGMLDGVPQRRPGSVTGYYTQAEVDEIAAKERKLEVDPDWFLKPPDLRDYKILSVDTEYVKPPLAEVADKLLPPVLNKLDSDNGWALVDAVFNARIEALAALRRFTTAEASSVMRDAWELSALLAADARLEAAERALKEAGRDG